MSLATIPQYDDERITQDDGHAVVVGASMGGILAARVLADRYAEVTVLDRDELPDDPIPRRGVPQGGQPHALLEAGRATIEALFPGYGDDLEAAGGLVIDGTDFNTYSEGGFFATPSSELPMYSASRPLFEATAREKLSAIEGVEVLAPCQFIEYLTDVDSETVTGVAVRDGTGSRTEIDADLVVDATGRTSRTPKWLETHGYQPPPVEEVRVDVGYSSVVVDRPPEDRRAILCLPEYPRTRGGAAFPIEGDRWIVSLQGMHGDYPPTQIDDVAAFVANIPVGEIHDILETRDFVSDDVRHFRYPGSRRHRYDRLRRFPDGLVVFGDAVASFNPIYGQGMSAAALQALVLHHALAEGDEDLGLRFFERVAPVVENVWLLAVGADFAYPETEGTRPRGTGLFGRYVSQLTRRAHTDGWLTERFFRVLMLEEPSTSLLRPRVLWHVYGPRFTRNSGRVHQADAPTTK